MFKGFWLDNKQFLLLVGVGLGVFLLADWFIGDFVTKANLTEKKCDTLSKDVKILHKDLSMDSHFMEKDKFEAYQGHEKELAKALCMPPGEQLDLKSGQLSIKFDQAISDTWAGLRQQASKAGILLPATLTKDDFGVQQDDDAGRYQEHYSYLSIVERSIGLLIKAGAKEIGTPIEILDTQRLGVKDNDSSECVYQVVSIPVTLSFGSLQNVLDKTQDEAGPYLQVRLRGLDAKGATNEEDRALQGDLEFVGFRLEERQEAASSAGPGKSGGRRRRRIR